MSDETQVYFTARHLLDMLRAVDDEMLDLPLLLIHGKKLHKPNLVSGFIPAPVEVGRKAVESKKPSLLTLATLFEGVAQDNGHAGKAKKGKAKSGKLKKKKTPRVR